MKRKIRVGVIFGGKSGEHEVSLMSAQSVMRAIDKGKYEVVPIGITHEGRWLTGGDPLKALTGGQTSMPQLLESGYVVDPVLSVAEGAGGAPGPGRYPLRRRGRYGERGRHGQGHHERRAAQSRAAGRGSRRREAIELGGRSGAGSSAGGRIDRVSVLREAGESGIERGHQQGSRGTGAGRGDRTGCSV